MKKPNLLIKVAAVVSSVLLVSAFVCYRAGAFNWFLGSNNNDAIIMGGSKSKILVDPGTFQKPPDYSPEPAPGTAFMSSSKSIIFVPPPKAKGTQPAAPSQSSKPAP